MKLSAGVRARPIVVACAVVVVLIAALLSPGPAQAEVTTSGTSAGPAASSVPPRGAVDTGIVSMADLSQFRAGNIISDAKFFDRGTMNEGQIQQFLQSKVPSCQAGYVCLKDWYDTSRATGADAMCGAYPGGYRERASAIIYKVAQACGINPQVILVMLQKEQGLVTHTWPSDWRYTIAMGQGCPDTAACDTRYYGFFNQVYGAAWQLKRYANPPGTSQYFTWYAPGKTWNVRWHPNAACGSSPVYIENQATADLYYYTPYQPNAAALRAGYGESSDPCSSYGNRNFFQYFTDWFGSTQTPSSARSPFGGYNLVVERGQFTVQGWTLDPDEVSRQLTVSLTVDGEADWEVFTANSFRPDVGAAYPGYGDNHGMNSTHQIAGGDHNVCVTVRNVGAGFDTQLGCTVISVESASPQGGTSMETLPGGARLTGWTLDLDTTSALAVHVYVDGIGTAYVADAFRPDVGDVYPGHGDNHGIDVPIALSQGTHRVCAYGINVGRGVNSLLGCHDVNVTRSGDPVGALESAIPEPGGIRVRGWALDPNSSSSIGVHVYRGSTGVALTASLDRQDLLTKYPDNGSAHGFDARISAPAGTSQVCAYGINTGFGANALVACRSVTVMSGSPFGGIDVSVQGGTARLRGWTIDPDTAGPIPVHVYIDGRAQAITAAAKREDVGAAYPGYGPLHGIDTTFDLSGGPHTLCAYGINSGPGSNALLGCVNFTVTSGSPFGGTDVTVNGNEVRLGGWTIDPDTTDPIAVHVYVDGRGVAVTTANVARPDVGAAYPTYGVEHGIDTTFALTAGNHQVCSYAINAGPGSNTLLACQTLVIR